MRKAILLVVPLAGLLSQPLFAADLVDNPAYKAWSSFKPGTTVTYQITVTAIPSTLNHATAASKLVEVTPESLTIETTTVLSSDGMPTRTSKATVIIKAKIGEGQEMDIPAIPDMNAEIKDVQEGKETVDFKDSKLETTTRQQTVVMTAAPNTPATSSAIALNGVAFTTQMWSSTEIPGGIFRRESKSVLNQKQLAAQSQIVVNCTIVK
ncbi:MAG TPA: hypothetical protein VHM90_01585 [Phycisphaerae bacterium]|nr:hypothetical protein [Phycisphaerae bacterium]